MESLQEISEKNQIQKWKPDEEYFHFKEGSYVSEEEYWEKYYEESDCSYEWNNGKLEVKPVSDYSGYLMYKWLVMLLDHFLTVNPIGKIVGLEFGFRMSLPGKTTIRKPDLGFVLNTNPAMLHLKDRSYKGIFDLCIEALSDSTVEEIKRDTLVKKSEYEAAGVQEYYILDPNEEETVFYRYNEDERQYEAIKPVYGDIIRSEVLTGFCFRISDLYQQPCLEKMSGDPVYKEFILPFYQTEKQKAEQAEKLLITEKQKAEQAQRKAEQAQKLLIKEKQNSEKSGLIGEIRAFRRLLKYQQYPETGLIQKSNEELKAMVEQLESELSGS